MSVIIKNKINKLKEELFENIISRFRIPVTVKIVHRKDIIDEAEGCFEGDVIKISNHLPLFMQLIVLEHEIGHYHALKDDVSATRKTFKIYHKKDEGYEKEELQAWKWVEKHPIKKQGIVDQEINKFIEKISELTLENPCEEKICLTSAFWF